MDLTHHDNKFERTDIWREGKWLDLWSAVHFLSGISIGLGFYFLHFGAFASVVLALVALTAYEMWEALVKIEEAPTNRFMDVVVGMASFLPTYFFLAPALSELRLVEVFVIVFVANVVGSVVGWRASQKAIELQKRMMLRYTAERAKLLEQQAQFRKRFHRK